MRKELKHNTKETIKLQRKREKKEGTERNYKNSQKTINKMTISTCLSIKSLSGVNSAKT